MAHASPRSAAELERRQVELAELAPTPWTFADGALIGGCFVCFPRGPAGPGVEGDRAWAAAVSGADAAVIGGSASAPYAPGLLALRAGSLLEAAVRAVLDVPTVGVTHRPLLAVGRWPARDAQGATSPLVLAGRSVGCWLRTRTGARPLAVHPGWRTDAETACAVVLASVHRARTPEPLRAARSLAREARASASA
jgi:deoxyribonuclease V